MAVGKVIAVHRFVYSTNASAIVNLVKVASFCTLMDKRHLHRTRGYVISCTFL